MSEAIKKYDVAIIGSGIGGSTLASVLARQGLSVVVFEGGSHPRFTIGESMILETSEAMRALAEFYDVPELAYYSSENFYTFIGTQHGVKRHFSFVHHTPGEHVDLHTTLQAVIPKRPYGHEIHITRQDSDYFLTSVAISYGATVLQNTAIKDIDIQSDRVEIITTKDQSFYSDYVVDAGGMKSVLAQKFNLRHRDLKTHSRTMFTHMINVPGFNEVTRPHADYGHPYPFSQGTLHHIFKGGWLWVIPFNNHSASTNPLCSVGLQLDPRDYPQRNDLTPEEEFKSFIKRFPDIEAQLKDARPVREWQRLERLQYAAHQTVGDRFALLAHAAGFIDPLYSKGLYITHAQMFLMADLILKAKKSGDYTRCAFAPLETMTLQYVAMHDRLVASAYLEYVRLVISRYRAGGNRAKYLGLIKSHRLAGGGFDLFFEIQEKIDAVIDAVNPDDDADVERAVTQVKAEFARFPWLASSFKDLLEGKNHLPDVKLRPNLLHPQKGFMGSGEYRKHFFGEGTTGALVKKLLEDQFHYSPYALKRKRRNEARVAGQLERA
jgi:tetracycline 7-halogenase / FADH2 O2-dependent halogenase